MLRYTIKYMRNKSIPEIQSVNDVDPIPDVVAISGQMLHSVCPARS